MTKKYTLIIFVLVFLTTTHGFAADSNADGPFKWHPGHYVFPGDYELIPVATELADYTAVRSFQKEVLRLTETHVPAGNYGLPFHPESVTKGLFFIKLQPKEIRLSSKVIIN